MLFPSWYRKGTFHMGYLFPTFRRTKDGQHVFSAPTVSQVTLIQNDQYTKNGIFWSGIVCFSLPSAFDILSPCPAFSRIFDRIFILSNKFSKNSPYPWCFLLVTFYPLTLTLLLGCITPTCPCYIWDEAQIYTEVCLPISQQFLNKICLYQFNFCTEDFSLTQKSLEISWVASRRHLPLE